MIFLMKLKKRKRKEGQCSVLEGRNKPTLVKVPLVTQPASSARTAANQGIKCLPEVQPGLNSSWELQYRFL